MLRLSERIAQFALRSSRRSSPASDRRPAVCFGFSRAIRHSSHLIGSRLLFMQQNFLVGRHDAARFIMPIALGSRRMTGANIRRLEWTGTILSRYCGPGAPCRMNMQADRRNHRVYSRGEAPDNPRDRPETRQIPRVYPRVARGIEFACTRRSSHRAEEKSK